MEVKLSTTSVESCAQRRGQSAPCWSGKSEFTAEVVLILKLLRKCRCSDRSRGQKSGEKRTENEENKEHEENEEKRKPIGKKAKPKGKSDSSITSTFNIDTVNRYQRQ